MRKTPILAALAAAATLSACGQSASHSAASPKPSVPSARALADCSKLRGSALPLAAVDQLVTREVSRLAGGGNASPAQMHQAKAAVTSELRSACPKFVPLVRQLG